MKRGNKNRVPDLYGNILQFLCHQGADLFLLLLDQTQLQDNLVLPIPTKDGFKGNNSLIS